MSESIRFCGMDHSVRMFGRRVNSKQFQRFVSGINKIVFRSGRHSNHIAGANIVRFARHYGPARAFHKNKDLINSFVDFAANVLPQAERSSKPPENICS
jgi:hypothetical protein